MEERKRKEGQWSGGEEEGGGGKETKSSPGEKYKLIEKTRPIFYFFS